ncbi:MAG: hypothetical protein H6Q41_2753 [Deltaproteobacteria bacterium]|nr:hypothetical protein [Deltaproteobacteria bacterium]
MKRIVFVFALTMALSAASLAFAQDKCTVSGEVAYSKDSNIYVCLLNSKTFGAFVGRQKELPPSGFMKIVKADAAGKASFAFGEVPKGEYAIIAFADERNNGELDRDTQGWALEPVRTYKATKSGIWNWGDNKFEVNKDVTGLVLNFRD